MSILMVLAVLVAAYLAGGVLTLLAVAFIGRTEARNEVAKEAATRSGTVAFWLKVFALWPCVAMMGVVFATLMLMQQRQSRHSPTLIGRVVWVTEMAFVLAVGCLAAPAYLVLALGWRLRKLGASRSRSQGA
jgi:hypothetical protein